MAFAYQIDVGIADRGRNCRANDRDARNAISYREDMNLDFESSKVPLFSKLCKLPLGAITAGGWIKRQLEHNADGLGGHMDELEPDMIKDPYIVSLSQEELDRRREQQRQGRDLGNLRSGWYAEISASYWTGLVQLAFTLGDRSLIAKAENWVNGVLAHQEEDGYIGSYLPTDNRMEDYNAWGTNWAIRALLSYYEATGRQDVLEACHRGLLWFVENWKDHRTDYVGPTLVEGMVAGYVLTGDKRLLDWAEACMPWLEQNSKWPNSPSALSSPRLPYNSMHVVAYGEGMKLPAVLYAVDGRQDYLQAGIQGAAKILANCTQRTGAPSSNNEFLSPPGATHETEYCNFATFANSYAWLAMITGDGAYAGLVEKIVFNGAQGARKKDERAIEYMSSPNQLYATERSSIYHSRQNIGVYAPVYNIACCPAQSVRVLPEYVRCMCMKDAAGGLYFMGYGPCSVRAGSLHIEEQTDYPFDGTVRLSIHAADPVRQVLRLRIPAWSKSTRIFVNGSPKNCDAVPGSFAVLDGIWKEGDTVEIQFEMTPKVEAVSCHDTPMAPLLAVERGPLLFSLPITESWKETKGTPLTLLPEGWSWFNVTPVIEKPHGERIGFKYDRFPWNYAIKASSGLEKRMAVEYRPEHGYPWEDPPVVIRIPAHRAKILYPRGERQERTINPYLNPAPAEAEEETLKLVPYGCTALRITYFLTAIEEETHPWIHS